MSQNLSQEQKTVDVSVEIDQHAQSLGEYSLKVTLTNRSADPLTVYQHDLPWVGWYSILLIAVEADATGTTIEKRLPVDDPGPAMTLVQPGETLTGTISLPSRFPTFLEALRDRDIIVFWSYQVKPIDAVALPRVGGYVLVPKLS